MLKKILRETLGKTIRHLLLKILVNQHFLNIKLDTIMSAAEDLQAMVAKLKASQATMKTALDSQKVSLDAVKTGIAAILAGLPATGGMTADEVTALKASLADALSTEDANTAEATDNATEASDEATAVSAAQPTPVTTEPPVSTDTTV